MVSVVDMEVTIATMVIIITAMMEEAGPVEEGGETARLAAAVVNIVVAVEIAEVAAMAVGIAEVAAMAVEENNQ